MHGVTLVARPATNIAPIAAMGRSRRMLSSENNKLVAEAGTE